MTMKIKNSKANYHQICKNNFNEVPKGYCLFVFHLRVQLKKEFQFRFFLSKLIYTTDFFLLPSESRALKIKPIFQKSSKEKPIQLAYP